MNLTTQYLGLTLKHPLMPGASPMVDDLDLVRRLEDAGAAAIVMHSLFEEQITLEDSAYHFHIDIENLEVLPTLRFSDSSELRLRLRWLAILHAAVDTSFAISGGVHTAADAIKAIMAGADAVQIVSALLQHGPERLGVILDDMTRWLDQHEYNSLDQLRGSMSLRHCPDPAAIERTNYLRVLQSWRV